MGEKLIPSIEISIETDKYFGFKINQDGYFFECDVDAKVFDTYFWPYVIFNTPSVTPQAIMTLSHDKNRTKDGKNVAKHEPFHYEFEHPVFHRLTTDDIASFHVSLLDLTSLYLKLLPRRPTVLKIKIHQVINLDIMPDINISVSSKPQTLHKKNNPLNFTTELAESIMLYGGNWNMALISASIPTRYKLNFSDEDLTLHFKILINEEENQQSRQTLRLHNSLHCTEEIVTAINQLFMANEAKCFTDTETGAITMISRYPMRILLRGKLSFLLGGADEDQNCKVLEIPVKIGRQNLFKFPPRFSFFFPLSLFVYTNVIESPRVGNQSLKLLKILPTSFSNDSSAMKNIYFKNLKFHPIRSAQLSTLHFEIRTETGDEVQFSESDNPVLLNLLITKNTEQH